MDHHLVYYGNTTLASVAERVENIDDDILSLISEMSDIMTKEKGLGLAAPQVDVGRRIIIVDPGDNKNSRFVLINPEIKEFSEQGGPYEEGCLSVPGIFTEIIRPSVILVKGITPDGKETQFEASGLTARIIQHEVDHLDGILFIDRVDKYIRDEFRQELKKIKKLNRA